MTQLGLMFIKSFFQILSHFQKTSINETDPKLCILYKMRTWNCSASSAMQKQFHFHNSYKTLKSTKNQLSNFGLIEEAMELSRILLDVIISCTNIVCHFVQHFHLIFSQILYLRILNCLFSIGLFHEKFRLFQCKEIFTYVCIFLSVLSRSWQTAKFTKNTSIRFGTGKLTILKKNLKN